MSQVMKVLVFSGKWSLRHHLFDILNTSPCLLHVVHWGHRHCITLQTLLILQTDSVSEREREKSWRGGARVMDGREITQVTFLTLKVSILALILKMYSLK